MLYKLFVFFACLLKLAQQYNAEVQVAISATNFEWKLKSAINKEGISSLVDLVSCYK